MEGALADPDGQLGHEEKGGGGLGQGGAWRGGRPRPARLAICLILSDISWIVIDSGGKDAQVGI